MFLLPLVLSLLATLARSQVLEGVVHLDKLSFDKIIGQFDFSFVKFDTGYPTGEKHKNFGVVATQIGDIPNLVMAEVRIKNYGDKNNGDLADRFNVNKEEAALPESILFSKEGGEVARYGGDYSVENLRLFVSSKTGLYVKLEGCIKELDQLAERFAKASSKDERGMVLFAAEHWAKSSTGSHQEEAQVYVKLMKAALKDGLEAVEKEKSRIRKILEDKVSQKVMEKMARKLNVISSFLKEKEILPKKVEL